MAFADFQSGFGHMVKSFRQAYDGGQNLITVSQVAIQNQDQLTPAQAAVASQGYANMENSIATWNTTLLTAAVGSWIVFGAEEINRPFQSNAQVADDLVRYMDANGIYVAGLVVTYGANASDAVVGIHRRLTVNKYAHRIETGSHNIPGGITMRVTQTEASGGVNGQTTVSYEGDNTRGANSLRVKGTGILSGVLLIGPLNTGLADNATLTGNADTADNDPITDGTAETGGIPSWNQTRTGTPTVTVDTTNKWKDQEYGVAIGGATATFEITQDLENWDMQAGVPVGYMIPAYQNGVGLDVDIVASMGTQSDSWDETDLTDGVWVPLISTFDENLYPENLDDTDSVFSLLTTLNAPSTGEVIYGGVYSVNGFQLQAGGEWHFAWEKEVAPALYAEVSYGADSQTDAGELQKAWVNMFVSGPSLPVTGSSLWSLP